MTDDDADEDDKWRADLRANSRADSRADVPSVDGRAAGRPDIVVALRIAAGMAERLTPDETAYFLNQAAEIVQALREESGSGTGRVVTRVDGG